MSLSVSLLIMQIVTCIVIKVILRSISTLLPSAQSLFEVYFSLFKLHARHCLMGHSLKPICHITLLLLYLPVSPSLSLPSLSLSPSLLSSFLSLTHHRYHFHNPPYFSHILHSPDLLRAVEYALSSTGIEVLSYHGDLNSKER